MLVGVLGRGGQATTYLARDQQSQEWVAVKELDLGRVDDWKSIELFEREAVALERMEHPSIPSYIAHFSIQEGDHVRFFLVQQFVAGADLGEEIRSNGPLDEIAAARVRDAVFDILDYLHGHQPPIVHRDIKPSNLLRTRDGRIVLVDFGAVQSKQAATVGGSTVVGTTGYMPTEQFMGRAVPASDLYALGATLVHLLTGTHPGELEVRDNRLVIEGRVNASAPFMNGLHQLLEPAVERRVADVEQARAAFVTAMVAPAREEPAEKKGRSWMFLPVAVAVLGLLYAGVWAYREFIVDPRLHYGVPNIHASEPADAKRVLFVGNSHTYWENQPAIVAKMVPKDQPPLWFEVWAWPAAQVGWHVDHDVDRALDDGWDHVVLQPQSVEPALPGTYFAESMEKYERLLPDDMDSIVWVPKARHPDYDPHQIYNQTFSGGSYEELTRRLDEGVRAWVSKSRVCPVGPAWAAAREELPSAPLYRTEDGNKAAPAGVYLTGLMLYGCIYQRDPAEVTWVSDFLTESSAAKLRKVASATWRNHNARNARENAKKVPKLKGLKGMKMKIDF